jgi:hypothetical protein
VKVRPCFPDGSRCLGRKHYCDLHRTAERSLVSQMTRGAFVGCVGGLGMLAGLVVLGPVGAAVGTITALFLAVRS